MLFLCLVIMDHYYKSNGKFMLTGEYLVLKGATALALPLKLGQSLDVEVSEENENRIYWNAYKKSTDNRYSSQPTALVLGSFR